MCAISSSDYRGMRGCGDGWAPAERRMAGDQYGGGLQRIRVRKRSMITLPVFHSYSV